MAGCCYTDYCMADCSTFSFYEMGSDDWLLIKHDLTQEIDGALVWGAERNASETMLSYKENEHGDWYYNNNDTLFYYLGI